MPDAQRNSWNNPPGWLPWVVAAFTAIAAIFTVIATVFTVIGPLKPETLNKFPSILSPGIALLIRCRPYIIGCLVLMLGYWTRSFLLRVVLFAYEWLYIKLLVFLLRPVISRINDTQTEVSTADTRGASVKDTNENPTNFRVTDVASSAGWVIRDNWEVPPNNTANWEIGNNWITGKVEGTVLWRGLIPQNARITFQARVVAHTSDTNEIDTIVGDSMILYFSGGVRQDYMTDDLQRERGQQSISWLGPQAGRWYSFTIEKKGKDCAFLIDDRRVMSFSCDIGKTRFRGRLGFAHWHDRVEFKNLKIENCTLTAG